MRSQAREVALKILYSKHFNKEEDDKFFESLSRQNKLNGEDVGFAKALIERVEQNIDLFNGELEALSYAYKPDRVFLIDKIIIYMAFAEIKFFDDVPPVVSIDEAVKLVKLYSTENSCNFVNGILAAYIKDRG